MFDDQPWYVAGGAGAVFGLLVGLAIGASGDEADKMMNARLAAIEESIASSNETTDGALAGLSEGNEFLKAEVAVVGTALAAAIEQLGQQNAIIGEGQAALGEQIEELAVGSAPAASPDPTAGPEAEEAEPADNDASAADSVSADGGSLADAIGPDGIVASAGQTALVGDGRLFVSRVTEEMVSALVVGGEKVELSIYDGEVSVGGCTLMLEGVENGSAYFRPAC